MPDDRSDDATPFVGETSSGSFAAVPQSNRLAIFRPFAPADLAPLACFRMFFGAMMLYHVVSLWNDRWIEFFYIEPDFHFTYPGFGWVRPWPGNGMYAHFAVMGIAALGIVLGFFYRYCAAVFCLGFTWVFLIEKALYQNHYYLICLISGIMIFVPAHRLWSVDALLWPGIRTPVAPRIWLWLLRAQLAIPYFYGGIAKLNSDWLHGMPMRLWLERRTYLPWVGPYLTSDAAAMVFSWGGLLFDLLIVPALLWRRTRPIAYVFALVFHLTNHILWDIGIFPWFMIGATLLFFPAGAIRRLMTRRSVRISGSSGGVRQLSRRQRFTLAVAGIYLSWQILFPFRHYLIPGNVSWTEEGHHFAWHMMLREKDVGIRFFMFNKTTGEHGLLTISEFLLERQLSRMGKDPDMILEFVHYVRDHYREYGNYDVEIRVLALASLNGRRPQLLIDPTIDYTKTDRVWVRQPWVYPLTEPLRKEGWNVPLDQWELELGEIIPNDMKSASLKQPTLDSSPETGDAVNAD